MSSLRLSSMKAAAQTKDAVAIRSSQAPHGQDHFASGADFISLDAMSDSKPKGIPTSAADPSEAIRDSLLFTLSAELRNKIYEFALHDPDGVITLISSIGIAIKNTPGYELTKVCRVVRAETTGLYYTVNSCKINLTDVGWADVIDEDHIGRTNVIEKTPYNAGQIDRWSTTSHSRLRIQRAQHVTVDLGRSPLSMPGYVSVCWRSIDEIRNALRPDSTMEIRFALTTIALSTTALTTVARDEIADATHLRIHVKPKMLPLSFDGPMARYGSEPVLDLIAAATALIGAPGDMSARARFQRMLAMHRLDTVVKLMPSVLWLSVEKIVVYGSRDATTRFTFLAQ